MRTFTKAQAASLVASCVDFLVTWLMVRQLQAPPVAGSVTGTICGGVTHFLISRNWAFSAQEKKWTGQLTRYVLVWIGNLILNASGVWLGLTEPDGLVGCFPFSFSLDFLIPFLFLFYRVFKSKFKLGFKFK